MSQKSTLKGDLGKLTSRKAKGTMVSLYCLFSKTASYETNCRIKEEANK
jgi:hypothetical protein